MLGMILARASGCEVSKRGLHSELWSDECLEQRKAKLQYLTTEGGLGSRRSFEKTVQELA